MYSLKIGQHLMQLW